MILESLFHVKIFNLVRGVLIPPSLDRVKVYNELNDHMSAVCPPTNMLTWSNQSIRNIFTLIRLITKIPNYRLMFSMLLTFQEGAARNWFQNYLDSWHLVAAELNNLTS